MEIILLLITVLVFGIRYYMRCSIKMCESNVSMKGKVVIVTGANSGIGFQTALKLAARGARVVLACRNEARGTSARDSIINLTGNSDVVFRKLDLSSLKSVREFASDIVRTEDQLHILVNNAGVYGQPKRTSDGIVESMQINYFGHFLLTLLLLPLLKKSQPSRIINLSSILHFFGAFDPETINNPFSVQSFESFRNYCNSKFCMLMFSVELSRRLTGTGVVVNAVHPGVILTGITSKGSLISRSLFWLWCLICNRTVEEGAKSVEHLAVAEECAGVSGEYFVDCARSIMHWKARNRSAGERLWEYSDKLVGYSSHGIQTISPSFITAVTK